MRASSFSLALVAALAAVSSSLAAPVDTNTNAVGAATDATASKVPAAKLPSGDKDANPEWWWTIPPIVDCLKEPWKCLGNGGGGRPCRECE